MITIYLIFGRWHVITRFDGAMMCRSNMEDWDYVPPSTEEKVISDLSEEDICHKCVEACKKADEESKAFKEQAATMEDDGLF